KMKIALLESAARRSPAPVGCTRDRSRAAFVFSKLLWPRVPATSFACETTQSASASGVLAWAHAQDAPQCVVLEIDADPDIDEQHPELFELLHDQPGAPNRAN